MIPLNDFVTYGFLSLVLLADSPIFIGLTFDVIEVCLDLDFDFF